jgi:LytS/YehU family sensor histidine kinase
MLLIVFIENAFKHSKNTADRRIYIDISLKTWENFILFTVRNSQSKKDRENNAVTKHSGYGMTNVARRLELLYPNEHNLEIIDAEDHYKVVLQLKMK